DLDGEPRAGDELDAYIFGSAEVVGLMCLAVFEHGRTRTGAEQATLEEGARSLGAAFQKVNFLRDIAADRDELGRRYVPGGGRELTERAKTAQLDDIRADLAAADRAIPLLDRGSRPAVWAARAVFGALADRIDRTPAAVVARERVRVTNGEKVGVLARALLRRWTRCAAAGSWSSAAVSAGSPRRGCSPATATTSRSSSATTTWAAAPASGARTGSRSTQDRPGTSCPRSSITSSA